MEDRYLAADRTATRLNFDLKHLTPEDRVLVFDQVTQGYCRDCGEPLIERDVFGGITEVCPNGCDNYGSP